MFPLHCVATIEKEKLIGCLLEKANLQIRYFDSGVGWMDSST